MDINIDLTKEDINDIIAQYLKYKYNLSAMSIKYNIQESSEPYLESVSCKCSKINIE